MGLIKAVVGAVGGVMADQWKEFFYCDAIDDDVLMLKGRQRTSDRSSNTKGSDNVITNGSGIAVADGQCVVIVDQGKIVEICALPGEYTYDMSTEPSIFSGSLGSSILETFKAMGKRISYGGDAGKDQRVYYFNTKEIKDNLFGTPRPMPFRIVDKNIGLDLDTTIRCNGRYSYVISDPILFYTNVAGNVKDEFRRSEIDATLKGEFINSLQPALAKISAMGIRYSELPAHTEDIADAMNEILSKKWEESRGIKVKSVAFNPITLSEEMEATIQKLQLRAVDRDPGMAATAMLNAQNEAMKLAAGNTATGPMMGFMNMNMAMQNTGAMPAQNFYQMAAQQQAQQAAAPAANTWTCSCGTPNTGKFCQNCANPKPAPAGEWTCKCGTSNSGKFCMNCGSSKPTADGWTCKCGAVNKGKFCMECGSPKPAGAPLYRCDKCGWEPADPANPPKFCPECADPFDENDRK
ncbi:MAG: SPFH domain-containing protein [Oscillospiraceae bacterium]|nr:SPFH domain-containing protein [Oscillospiraceae bacterium]